MCITCFWMQKSSLICRRLQISELNSYSQAIIYLLQSGYRRVISRNSLIPKEIKFIQKGIISLQTKLLVKENILIRQESHNWQEAIAQAAVPLLENGAITQDYVKAMIQSVVDAGPYFVLMPGFALAHARSEEGVNHLGLSALTLATPVSFGSPNDPVQVIFCLAATDSTSHLELMSELAEILGSDNIIERLAQAETAEMFLKILDEARV